MRTIPNALRQRLLERFKAGNTQPSIRLVATQVSNNTLLSEPIHTETPAYGDVTFRQMEGEKEVSLCYAVCLDQGVAKVYSRSFPAMMDYEWVYEFTLGPASDVAIEYDGTWTLDAENERYFLMTGRFPYIFRVAQGVLTVQHWSDTENAVQLATGVSVISTVRGWSNNIDIEQDQGVLVAYVKTDGTVWYRTFAMQESGDKIWETERQLTVLGSTNTSIAVTRTNDFRLAFLTEQTGNTMKMLLTKRNYAGMSVRPETVHAGTNAAMYFADMKYRYGYVNETVGATVTQPFFLVDEASGTPALTVTDAVRNNDTDNRLTESVTLTLSHALYGTVDAYFVSATTASAMVGTTATAVPVSGVVYDDANHTLTISFTTPPRKVHRLTVTTPLNRAMAYKKNQNMKWYLPSLTATLDAQVNSLYGYADGETVTAGTTAALIVADIEYHYTKENETVSAETVSTITLTAASIEPI